MTNKIEEELIQKLKIEGYTKVYIHDAKPNENYLSHSHAWDTKLMILEGELEVNMDDKHSVLRKGDQIEIIRNKMHSGKAGPKGCRYIVGERSSNEI